MLALAPLVLAGIELGVGHVVLALVAILVIARSALVVETRLALAEHAEIMVRILQIIFGLDAVAGELGVTRHALVLLEKLRGIATLAIILAVAGGLSALAPLSTTAAPAAAPDDC